MNLFRKLSGKKSEFNIRYSKADSQWQVYREKQLVYVGGKEHCQRYIDNISAQA